MYCPNLTVHVFESWSFGALRAGRGISLLMPVVYPWLLLERNFKLSNVIIMSPQKVSPASLHAKSLNTWAIIYKILTGQIIGAWRNLRSRVGRIPSS